MEHDQSSEPILRGGTDEKPPAYGALFPSREVTVTHINGQPNVTSINTQTIITNAQTKVYKRRWYVLFVYSLLAFTQGGLWNTWGPISASTEEAFEWSDSDIALLSNWGPIAYILAAFILSWVVDVKGLRLACLSTSFMVALGAGLRCITDDPRYVKWTIHTGQLLNGLAGPVAMGVPPAISSIWFPKHQRTTATALANILNSLGVGVSFIIGPYIVTDSPPSTNGSDHQTAVYDNVTATRIHHERKEIMLLMYIECAWSVFVFLVVLVYFPSKPPLPPSLSASVERVDFKTGLKALMSFSRSVDERLDEMINFLPTLITDGMLDRKLSKLKDELSKENRKRIKHPEKKNKKFWVICFTYGGSLGVLNCWASVLDVILKPHGISQETAGWLGFYSIIAGSTASVILAKFADVFSRHMRMFLLLLYISGSACFVWFTLLINGQLPSSTISLYVSIILANMLLNASVPLYYEMAVEVTYPVAEGITNFVLTLVNNISGLIFLGVQMVPNIGTNWENWCALGAILSCIPVLLLLKERYNRLEIDDTRPKESEESLKT